MNSKRNIILVAIIAQTALLFTASRGDVLFPMQVGQVWEFTVTDSREPGTPWTREWHILEIVDIAGSDYYHLGIYDYKTNQWETGVVYVNSDDDFVYLWDEGVYKVWPLSEMVPEHVVVPYGEFDAYYYDEGDWYNYFVPGVGYIKWTQFELTYTITGELVNIHIPTLGQIELDIDPDTLNLQSKGEWITCYIWLPEGYDVADIDPESILLNGQVTPDWGRVDETGQMLIVKFNRSEVQDILEVGEVELTISGELTDGTKFEGTDTITVIDKGGKK